jgi:hypothetical protein
MLTLGIILDLPQVSLEWVLIGYSQFIMRSVFKTDLIINWIYPIKTHSRETWGKSRLRLNYAPFQRPIRFLPETDYPRASRSFQRIAGSGNEIACFTKISAILFRKLHVIYSYCTSQSLLAGGLHAVLRSLLSFF